jgi:parvulin-like peptidyl-prolyl isomerase
MTVENIDPAGQTKETSATGGDGSNPVPSDGNSSSGTVPLEAHDRLLSEKKRLQAERDSMSKRLADLEAAAKIAEEKKLEETQSYKELAERRQRELETVNAARQAEIEKMTDRLKKEAFIRAVGGLGKPAFEIHIPVDQIALNETGNIDEANLKIVAENFKKDFPELVKANKTFPATPAPTGGGAPDVKKMTSAQILALMKENAKG